MSSVYAYYDQNFRINPNDPYVMGRIGLGITEEVPVGEDPILFHARLLERVRLEVGKTIQAHYEAEILAAKGIMS